MSSQASAPSEKTLAMTVANTGFMVDRLGQDCAPLQFLRELTQNSIEAILATPDRTGEIVWDVDWDTYALSDVYKLCIIDTGCGMTGEEMAKYINQLSSSVYRQSHEGNFGVGAKIAAATRNHAGLLYLSWKAGVGSTIHLWRDPSTGDYGLRQLERPGGKYSHWAHVEDSVKPRDDVRIDQHGTKVVLLGNDIDQNTMQPPEGAQAPSRWISKYLNTRYFRFPEGVVVKAREGWENPRADRDRNVLRTLTGQQKYLEDHKQASGAVELNNAVAHWWILKEESALGQMSGIMASSGHMAALYKDELYEMLMGRAGVARLQLFGVIFGYQRVVIYVEPMASAERHVTSNTARTNLLIDSEPLPWADWASEFRSKFPPQISELMEEITSGATASDHRQAIRERLRQIRELFRFSRYRPTPNGDKLVGDDVLVGGRPRSPDEREKRDGGGHSGGSGGRAGNIYALFLTDDGTPAEEFHPDLEPEINWISVEDGTRAPGFLEDRAAKYLPEQNLLQINGDFRGFTDMIDRWCKFYSHVPGARKDVSEVCREWFEQALIEAILGVQALKDSREWTVEDIGKSLSEEALTSAVMPRYHIDVAVKRALGSKLGSIKERAS
jgi:Histidine kinase-, DNA gyrase B-, and HSP90-like ATPase